MDIRSLPATPDAIREAVLGTNGRIFGAVVQKRDGDTRAFNARTFEDTGNERDTRNAMLTVLDIHRTQAEKRRAFRVMALEGVRELTCGDTRTVFVP